MYLLLQDRHVFFNHLTPHSAFKYFHFYNFHHILFYMKREQKPFKLIFIVLLTLSMSIVTAQQLSMTREEAQQAREAIISTAKQYIGTPYLYGGMTKNGIDCSGFVYNAVKESIDYTLPRSTTAMYADVTIISDSQKEMGDLLFFRTTGSGISHVAIYLGNNQFIHAASDGPNTGVIVSSLAEAYWKSHYEGIVGRFLPSGTEAITPTTVATSSTDDTPATTNDKVIGSGISAGNNTTSGTSAGAALSFLRDFSVDLTGSFIWNFYAPKQIKFNARGGSVLLNISYTGWTMRPGLTTGFNIEGAMGFTQIPLLLTVSLPYGFRVYMGPVFTLGKPEQIGSKERIYPSIFPGIIGASWQTGTLKAGKVEFAIAQDIYYSVFNDKDGAALSFGDAFAAGFVFSTGIRVILPLSNVL